MRFTNRSLLTLALPLAACTTPVAPPIEHDADAVSALLPGASHSGWLQAARTKVEQMEYRFLKAGRDLWSAPNRAQNLRATIGADGLELAARKSFVDTPSTWSLELSLAAFGREGSTATLAPPAVGGTVQQVDLDHGDVVEYWRNDHRGFVHELVLPQAPAGTEPLLVEFAVSGLAPELTPDGGAVTFRDGAGLARVRYAGLRVTDANGAELEAALVPTEAGFAVRVVDAGAAYPVTIDPLLSGPVWSDDRAPDTRFGAQVGFVGDLDADGYEDLYVGAPYYDGGAPDSGAVFVYFGSSAGPSTTPDWSCTMGTQSGLLYHATGVGDVNADGYDDLLVGSGRLVVSSTGNSVGGAWIWYGGPSAWSAPATVAAADWSFQATGEDLGWALSGGGDVNGDGVADFALGAPRHDAQRGRVLLFEGKAGGPGSSPDWTVEGPVGGLRFGREIHLDTDLDGDGLADLLTLNDSPSGGTGGGVYLYPGSAGGPQAASWSWSLTSPQQNIAGAVPLGDLDADGFEDVGLLLQEWAPFSKRRLGIVRGVSGGLAPLPLWILDEEIQYVNGFALYFSVVSGLGDVNADGFDDFALGVASHDGQFLDQGRVDLYLGSPRVDCPPVRTLYGAGESSGFGRALDGGDVDGDGFADLLVGAATPEVAPSTSPVEASAYLFLGGVDPPGTPASWGYEPNAVGTRLGETVAVPGDLDGDGFDELALSAPYLPVEPGVSGKMHVFYGSSAGPPATPDASTEGGRLSTFGYATDVAGAGDVDGDGLREVLVVGYDNSVLPLGNRVDLVSAPGHSTKAVSYRYTNKPSTRWSVRGVGDLDGDGWDDFALGRPERDMAVWDEGWVEVRSGHPNLFGFGVGAGGSLLWARPGADTGSRLGTSIGSADVDGDGRLDLIVGAPGELGGQGRVYVYANPPSGLSTTPTWTYTAPGGEGLGTTLATGFDWNDDGYEDFVVGGLDWPGFAKGSGFVIYPEGSTAGPQWPTWVTGFNQPDARYGAGLANAGDVDGDGRNDVLVGSPGATLSHPKEGFVSIYSAAQLPGLLETLWLRTGAGPLLEFGESVSAGDVDGDGQQDVLVGAPGTSNGENGEGAAYLFLGPLAPANP